MTAAELRAALKLLRMRQRAFAERLGVAPNTVYRWVSGAIPVPGYAAAFIEVLLREQAMSQ